MRREAGAFVVLLAALAWAAPAAAQPMAGGGMPDLRNIVGRPLPDRGMAAGTVSVRVARKLPANGAANVEVTAIIKNEGGDLRKRTAKTDGSGRAIFEAVAAGSRFKAEVTVDGERLATEEFTMPSEGGVKTMLIAGLGPAPAGGGAAQGAAAGDGGGDADFSLGAATGSSQPDPALPAKTLVVRALDENGKPIPNTTVTLGAIDLSNKIQVRKSQSNADGEARFTDLPTGKGVGYAAIIDWHGTRIGTEPFAMPESGGVRAEIHALVHTADPSVMTIASGGRIVVQLREDALAFWEMLPLENTSGKLFDPGPGAVEIPLPKGFVSAEGFEGSHKIEVRQNHGVAVHGAFGPKSSMRDLDAKSAGNEASFAFGLPYAGDTRDFEQPLPNGMGRTAVIYEQSTNLRITGPGLGEREERQLSGRKYWLSFIEGIPPGGTLKLTVAGLPSTDATGRVVAAALALALIAGAFAFGRRPRDQARRAAEGERERLGARREALFAELVAVEQSARQQKTADAPARRRTLIGELEAIYQQLAALDEQRAL